MDHMVSVPTTPLCHCNRKAAVDSMYMLGCGCVPTKLSCDLYMNMTGSKVLFPLGECDSGAASSYVPQITGEASHGKGNGGQREAEPRERNQTLPVLFELLDLVMPEAALALFRYVSNSFPFVFNLL